MDPLAVLKAHGLENADAIVAAATTTGVPLWVAAAMVEKESGGRNVYGNDWTRLNNGPARLGVYAYGPPDDQRRPTDPPPDPERPSPNVVTEANFRRFEARVLAGAVSNGVGPAQITYPGFIRDAQARRIRLWVPLENITYGLRLIAGYLTARAGNVAEVGTLYNAGNLTQGINAYGHDLERRSNIWRDRLTGETMALPRNTGTPAGVAALERALRAQRPDWQILCGPSMAGRSCVRGKHGHLWTVVAGRVTGWSTHYVDAKGGVAGPHVGGALDLNKDPRPGVPISTYEKAHGDDLVRELDALGYGCIWGVDAAHESHPHVDYRRANRSIKWQGPNYPFTVADILATQVKMKRLGLYTGALDGLREKLTRDAITAYQRVKDLRPDGDPGVLTQAALDADIVALAKAAAGPDYTAFTVPQIREAQIELKTAGWYVGADTGIDGAPGRNFQAAMKTGQEALRASGLYKGAVDLLPGPNFMAAIRAHNAGPKPAPAPAPAPTPTPAPAPPAPATAQVSRLAGSDRFATSVSVSRRRFPNGAAVAYLAATGTDEAGATFGDGPTLIVRAGSDALPAAIVAELRRLRPARVFAIGGQTSVTPGAAAAAGRAAAQ